MQDKIMQVFYGIDRLPYKDIQRQVHYPNVGSVITGENNTTKIKFYVTQIGGSERQWVANIVTQSGKHYNRLLTNVNEDEEVVATLDISDLYASEVGKINIGLQGYAGNVLIEEVSEGVYEINGEPTILATGNVLIIANYTPNTIREEIVEPTIVQQLLGAMGMKLSKYGNVSIIKYDSLAQAQADLNNLANGQVVLIGGSDTQYNFAKKIGSILIPITLDERATISIIVKEGLHSNPQDLSSLIGKGVNFTLKGQEASSLLGKQNTPFTVADKDTETYLAPQIDGTFANSLGENAKKVNTTNGHSYLVMLKGTFASFPLDSIVFYNASASVLNECALYEDENGLYYAVVTSEYTGEMLVYNQGRAGTHLRYTNGDILSSLSVIDLTELGDLITTNALYEMVEEEERAKWFSQYKSLAITLANGEQVSTNGKLYGASSLENFENEIDLIELGTYGQEISAIINEDNFYVGFKAINGLTIKLAETTNDYTNDVSYYEFSYPQFVQVTKETKERIDDLELVNVWKGKRWYCLGTSLTNLTLGKYVPYLTEKLKVKEVNNRGVSGGKISGHICYYADYYSTREIANYDLVTIEGGVNDWNESVPLGEVGDTTPYASDEDTSAVGNYLRNTLNGGENGTFAGACYCALHPILVNCPNATVVVITDHTGRYIEETGGNCARETTNSLDLIQKDYTDMLIAVAKYMGVKVIEAGSKSEINQEHPQYFADHIHPSELGGKQFAQTIFDELKFIKPNAKE